MLLKELVSTAPDGSSADHADAASNVGFLKTALSKALTGCVPAPAGRTWLRRRACGATWSAVRTGSGGCFH
jgi:hypothetical protein